ncbi:MAG: hypothetical protein U5K74_02880 [Gemmatimonadaceae bacterium]|nr:hypothetical protein [Gemmatimonadaceae bacterium]
MIALSCMGMLPLSLTGQARAGRASSRDVPAAIAAIREADLKRDLFALAADGMRGREARPARWMRCARRCGWPSSFARSA